jgi:peptidoglycan/LPS O-acetylase OafA/YrhL
MTTLGLGLLAYSTMGILHGTLDLTDGFGLVRSVSGFLIGASLYQLTSSLPQLKSLQIFSGLASAATLIFARNEWINLALICFAVLIVSLQTDAGAVAKFLRTKIMQHLGTISFSIYLAHYPLLRLFMSNADFNLQDLTVFFVVLWGLSLLTFRFVELPFQRLGRLLTPQWGDRA